MPTSTSTGSSAPSVAAGNSIVLALATAGFAINFWAWALLGPLGPSLRDQFDLTATQQSLVVAVPVIVGSLGRIPVGALTDRLGARIMFPLISLATILPVLYLGHVASTYAHLLIGGFFLGLGGTTFAIGIPLVNAWYPPSRRGTALGIFGAGTGGTAIAAFTTVPLVNAAGPTFPFTLIAIVLAAYAAASWILLRDRPGRSVATGGLLTRTLETVRTPGTISLAFLYAVAFGGFVAFSVYLPAYLRNAFEISQTDASLRTAGFVVLAVLMRPVGGALSDRYGPVQVLVVAFAAATGLAAMAAAEFDLIPVGTIAFLGLAAMLGAGSGAVFALVAMLAPADRVGSVTGVVGAAGGLGGFFPPLVMGMIYTATGTYRLGFVLLALTAAAACLLTVTAMRRRARVQD